MPESRETLPPYPSEEGVRRYVEEARLAPVTPVAAGPELYMDMAERIVRYATRWLDAEGRVVDPVLGRVWMHSSSRFVASLAPLICLGRCSDLLEPCLHCLDTAARDLAAGRGEGHDFWTRDLVLAMDCLADHVDAEQMGRWRRLLRSFDPYARYQQTLENAGPSRVLDWTFHVIAGEQMRRQVCGDRPDRASERFIERHLECLAERFSDMGLYREPGCPMAHDLAVRQNLVLLLMYRYDGPQKDFVSEVLRRGALTQLFYQSSTGEVPFGGRSSQFVHAEAMFCCVAEYEAMRYAHQGGALFAGVFKRAARRAAASVRRWVLDTEPFRHVKNLYSQESLHGCDPYGYVSTFGLLTANLFALAALITREQGEEPAEAAAPCDVGGYVAPFVEDFHRVCATAGPLHVQIDLRAQLAFDATGLCRFHHRDCPSELALSCAIVAEPGYHLCEPAYGDYIALGPRWRDETGHFTALAPRSPARASVEVFAEEPGRVAFRVTYEDGAVVCEEYDLTPQHLDLRVYAGEGAVQITVPLLLTNGGEATLVHETGTGFAVELNGHVYQASALLEGMTFRRVHTRAPNRNGVYDIALFEGANGTAAVRLQLT